MLKNITVIIALLTIISSVNLLSYGVEAPISDPNNLIPPFVSFRFVHNSQNIETNEFNALRDIYFFVSILNLTGQLDQLTITKKQNIIDKVQSFQNNDGGFGDWFRDRSKAGSTRLALDTLKIFNSQPINISATVKFISELQVSGLDYGNYGFRSSIKERDADVSSTYDALYSLTLLGANIPNRTGVIEYLKDHQNFDGGFGYQTNRNSGVFWTSTAIHTYRGLLALNLLNEQPTFRTEVVDFLKNLQRPNGGFSNEPGKTAQISYSYDVIVSLMSLGESIPRVDDIINFINNNQLANGGFLEYDLDIKEGLHTTYYAAGALSLLNVQYDGEKIVTFSENFLNDRLDGGFGNYPGLSSTVRYTFDGVSVLNLIGKEPLDRLKALQFIKSIENSDGGYGKDNESNVETTYRVIMTFQNLGEPLPHPILTAQYLRSCQNYDGGFGFTQNFVSRGAYTYRTIRALSILGFEPLNKEGAIAYLRSLQNSDGGFGNFYGEGESDLGATYYAVRGLAILGASPPNSDLAEDFIIGSQNPDGGFRRSPWDITAPSNFSRSIFTYDAILALHFLGSPAPNLDRLCEYIVSLRNPDLGFADQPFFTSTVSSTFTSLWSYFYLFSDIFNTAPQIYNGTLSPSSGSSKDIYNFTVDYIDAQGQRPEYVHLILNGVRYIMVPVNEKANTFFVNLQLPVGTNTYYFSTTDGIISNQTSVKTVEIPALANPPSLELSVDPKEGTQDTSFNFLLKYSDADGDHPVLVKLRIDHELWVDMVKANENTYTYTTRLKPGVHTAEAMAQDSLDMVITPPLQEPVVYPPNASRPDWDIFLRIQNLIKRTYDVDIKYSDVERSTYEGELAWKVDVHSEDVYVSYDGTRVLSDNKDDEPFLFTLLLIILVIVIVMIIVMLLIRKKKNK